MSIFCFEIEVEIFTQLEVRLDIELSRMYKDKNEWRKFFRFNEDDNMTRCLLCKKKKKYFSGCQTHNLKRHLIALHQEQAKSLDVKIFHHKKKENQPSSESESAEAWVDDTVDVVVSVNFQYLRRAEDFRCLMLMSRVLR